MVKGDTILVILRSSHAWAAGESLLHLGLGARTTRKVSISTDRCETTSSSSEVMVGDGVQRCDTMAVVRAIAATTAAPSIVGLGVSRVEGRGVRVTTVCW